MTREEIVKSLRGCELERKHCDGCCIGRSFRCQDLLMRVAADMLESDVAISNASSKTADEMFRELGYLRSGDGYAWMQYKKEESESKATTTIDFHKGFFHENSVVMRCNGKPCWATASEIRAVCKLLDEMGVE